VTRARQRRAERRAGERRSTREQLLEKFGAGADERALPDRRAPKSADETERILAELGIADRRRGQRRRR
jgi:hypothetical protein